MLLPCRPVSEARIRTGLKIVFLVHKTCEQTEGVNVVGRYKITDVNCSALL